MKNETPQQRELRYLNALKELKNVLSYTDNVFLTGFSDRFGISRNFGKILIDAKILQKKGATTSVRYNWIGTIEPNLQMAKRVYEESKKVESIKNTKRRTKENPVVTFDKRKNNGGKSTKTNGVDMRKKEYRDIPKVGLIRTFLRWIY